MPGPDASCAADRCVGAPNGGLPHGPCAARGYYCGYACSCR
ncbi:ring finger protein 208 [Burkholderia multivorans CGD2M]|uniref:Ring finger protein 208 n=1 Tax=Burkholderia multivorans CGD2 TaxID=513052 RepID=B9BL45_9BURK|nr:ring finger protein 208 [Burkholderia multivorans CGD2]EEE16347.1 ring finger protein 208 [Burkholderia multivorans CGD2M]